MVILQVIIEKKSSSFLQKPTEYGDIMFSLSYLPTAERLTIVIVKARNLKMTAGKDVGGTVLIIIIRQ